MASATDTEIEYLNTVEEIQKIDAQFTASRQRISEMAATPGYKKTPEYQRECDWRRRASYAKQKLLDDLREIKARRKEENVGADGISNSFTRRIKAASIAAILAYENGTSQDMEAAIDGLRAALGEAAP